MGTHQDILPQVISTCASVHEECGVVLIGSVARGTERSDSDLDLNVIFPRDDCPLDRSPWIDSDNRWQLQRKDEIQGIRIDIAWETQQALLKRLNSDDVVNCWPFSNGVVLRDPCNVASPCLDIARQWFANQLAVTSRFEQQYAKARREQLEQRRDDDGTLGRT